MSMPDGAILRVTPTLRATPIVRATSIPQASRTRAGATRHTGMRRFPATVMGGTMHPIHMAAAERAYTATPRGVPFVAATASPTGMADSTAIEHPKGLQERLKENGALRGAVLLQAGATIPLCSGWGEN